MLRSGKFCLCEKVVTFWSWYDFYVMYSYVDVTRTVVGRKLNFQQPKIDFDFTIIRIIVSFQNHQHKHNYRTFPKAILQNLTSL